ncbi:hypothetical protein [Sinomicrobium soli]|uniref:hypothetical protein n=1 Tax=Sinomicrobium sp. N-1-3-6 TaxID=2219864 RepID=UPI000DCCCA15|nr:hypothetical protein [Sinomicrobium sp. N-1-3-6]RAV30902.1 hypothetical protein DN748_01200 [Sinomicrobium sp. N-1-3-6]
MKTITHLFICTILTGLFWACADDDGPESVRIAEPTDITAGFIIRQDNSGEVEIFPSAKGANAFVINFGDGSEASGEIAAGQSVSHTYTEGNYTLEITAKNLNGNSATATKELVLSFLPPENLEVTIDRDNANPFTVTVSATADHAAGFEVYFGEDENEEPAFITPEETASHEYRDIGTYTIRVVALSGGTATTEYTEDVEISTPLVLPITFEIPTVAYDFYYFGGGDGTMAALTDNPAPDNTNNSSTVAAYTKPPGSETWAGISAVINGGVDFSASTAIAVDVYAPEAGMPVLLKMEKEGDPDTFVEFRQHTTVAGEWETLVFDLSARDESAVYSTLVLFFNFDIPGEGETYYFDNIRPAFPELPLTFEDPVSYPWMNFGGATSGIADNPDKSGINTSEKVTGLFKGEGAETWAGSNIMLDGPIDLSGSQVISIKTWSPVNNATVLLKLEDSGSDHAVEISSVTTKTEEWETLSFDFSGTDNLENLDVITIFMDFDQTGRGDTFYFDDIALTH